MDPHISQSNYILLSTRKKDGSRVATPVWFAEDNGFYYVFSAGNAGKIKRLRNFSDITVAPCTVTGKPLGEALNGRAIIFEAEKDIVTAHSALLKHYGWTMRMVDLGSWLTGKINKRKFIRIKLDAG
jgi:PPOX class probable F420-dependent enzyme